jgi:hypothetical protein
MQTLLTIPKISGENAVSIESLPKVWQHIAAGGQGYKMRDRESFVKMAQLFLYKMQEGDVELFTERSEFQDQKEAFTTIMKQLAWETLEFYGVDFHESRYPDFSLLRASLDKNDPEYKEKEAIISLTEELFEEFRYDMPASFYYVHLSPLKRDFVSQMVPLRFSEDEKKYARQWDAALHGQKVFPIQLFIQSISSKYGFFWEHGCGCNHRLAQKGKTNTTFAYAINPEMKETWKRDYIWTCWYEYALFNLVPTTKFLVV